MVNDINHYIEDTYKDDPKYLYDSLANDTLYDQLIYECSSCVAGEEDGVYSGDQLEKDVIEDCFIPYGLKFLIEESRTNVEAVGKLRKVLDEHDDDELMDVYNRLSLLPDAVCKAIEQIDPDAIYQAIEQPY